MATYARVKKQVPTDVWSVRERLAMACSVLRSGDQNWVSVSRAIRPYGEPNRPPDWFSPKNCALQYNEFLEKVETPKRKRNEKGETETPGDQIVRKLTNERVDELRKLTQDAKHLYKKLKREVEEIKAGIHDDRLKDVWDDIQKQKKAQEELALKTSEEAKNRMRGLERMKQQAPGLRLKLGANSEGETSSQDVTVKTEIKTEPSAVEQPSPSLDVPTPTTDPKKPGLSSQLLSTLLQSKAEVQPELQTTQLATTTTSPAAKPIKAELPLDDPAAVEDLLHDRDIAAWEEVIDGVMDMDMDKALEGVEIISTPTLPTPTEPTPTLPEIPSSPSVGAPTLSRLLVTPPVSSVPPSPLASTLTTAPAASGGDEAELVVTVEQEEQTESKSNAEEAKDTLTTESVEDTPGPKEEEAIVVVEEEEVEEEVEVKEVKDVEEVKTPQPPPVEVKETPAPKESRSRSASGGFEETKTRVAVVAAEEEPPLSPASSIGSTELDHSIGLGRGKGGPKPGSTGGKVRSSRRTSGRTARGRHADDEKKGADSKPPSEMDSSEDEANKDDLDDSTSQLTPRRKLSLSESVPNSPASITHSDTEDEKAHKVWKKSIMLVWRAAANHKYANVFLHPVREDLAPGYHSVVFRPMDLSTIKKGIENGSIRTTAEFQRDMMLMFTNAIMYNNSDHNVFHMAMEMYNDVMHHIEQFVNTQMMVQSEVKILRTSRRSEAATQSDKEDDGKKRKAETEGGKTKKRKP